MRARFVVLTLLLACLGIARAAEPGCAGVQAPREYAGPLFDAMAQIESGMPVLEAMEQSHTSGMALFARQHPKRNGEADVASLKRRFPQQFVMGTPKSFTQRGDLSDGFLQQTLSDLQDARFQFVGEILFAHADKSHGEQTAEGERFVSPEGKNVSGLLEALSGRNVPVMAHWEVYDWERDWPAFDALYSRFPRVVFIWPHAGFASAGQVRTVLAAHENVVVTLSKKESDVRSLSSEEKSEALGEAVVDDCGALRPEWRALLQDYPQRFLYATDAHKGSRWASYAKVARRWRRILGQLPEPLARALAWENAQRVYGAPR